MQYKWRTPDPANAIEIDPNLSLAQYAYKLEPQAPVNSTYATGNTYFITTIWVGEL